MASSTRESWISRPRSCSSTIFRRSSLKRAESLITRFLRAPFDAVTAGPPGKHGSASRAAIRRDYSIALDSRGVALPGAGGHEFADPLEGKIDFFVARVEVGRKAHTGGGAVIHHDVAGQQLARNLGGVGAADGDGAAARGGGPRGIHPPAAGEGGAA